LGPLERARDYLSIANSLAGVGNMTLADLSLKEAAASMDRYALVTQHEEDIVLIGEMRASLAIGVWSRRVVTLL
jgi:hypothetical protein